MALEAYMQELAKRDWEREPATGTVRFAVIGIGGFARNRALPAIERTRSAESTVLVSGSPERTTDIAERYDVPYRIEYETFLDGARVDEYDAVYVATPNALHGRYAIAAAEYGKHVLCQKPLETTAKRSAAIVDACEDAGITLMTAYRIQLEPTVRRVREALRDSAIGTVVQVHGAFSNPLLDHADPSSWRLDPDLAGGGALVDLGIYPLNTARFLLEERVTAVAASTHSSGAPFDAVEEHVAFQLRFDSGATASCTASLDAHANSSLTLYGTEGLVSISSPFGGVVPKNVHVERGDVCVEHVAEPVDEVCEEIAHFCHCVLTGTNPDPDGVDGLSDVQIIEAIYEAAAKERWVGVETTST